MGRKIKDRTGEQFGKWTVKEFSHIKSRPSGNAEYWVCSCSCGTVTPVEWRELRKGNTTSCGCVRVKHGMDGTPIHNVWRNMRARCYNTNNPMYKHYGGRGITVCDRWKDSFEDFYNDMGDRPSNKHSIDREDNNGNYESSNCRWATKIVQANNTRSTRLLEYNGKNQSSTRIIVKLTLCLWKKSNTGYVLLAPPAVTPPSPPF